MKRRMIAAATLGTLILGAGNPALAAECNQVRSNEPMVCREIAASDLGSHMCLATERFEFRGVKPNADHDPWVTNEAIKLGTFTFNPTSEGCSPVGAGIPLANSTLSIAKSGSGYRATLSGATNAQIDMTVARDSDNNELWLTGHDAAPSKINYFIYFRDKPAAGAAQTGSSMLPKFLVIEALDFNNEECRKVAPSLERATVKTTPCEHPVGGKPRESGVGGGGEHKGP